MTENNISPLHPAQTGAHRKIGKVDERFYIVGVGASAGGLDAIKQVLARVPVDFAHSFVVVQHLSPDYKSLMTEILGRETQHKVVEVSDNMRVEPKHIYVIPPGANIVIQGTEDDVDDRGIGSSAVPSASKSVHEGLRFSLLAPQPRPALNLPIDIFFRSLAEAVGKRAIGVILSGTGSDGSRGLRSIKDREGLVIAQEPATCGFDGMPQQAIATGLVDQVLQPDDIVGEIARFIELRDRGISDVDEIFDGAQDSFRAILETVSKQAEIDFALYKEPTLQRRIARRMGFLGLSNLEDYLSYLGENSGEVQLLYREFLVGVTNFFRDLPVWQAMETRVLKRLFEEGDIDQPLRVWSVGCSTGEEAYALAMLLQKFRDDNQIERDFRIYATDVNENAINTAKQGIYPDHTLEEIPEAYRNAGYITHHPGTFAISPTIRSQIVFAVHDITLDPPYTRTDLIVCRNLLIYLGPDVQAKVMVNFSMSLRINGYLLLGAAETPGSDGVRFEYFMGKERIFRNKRVARAGSGRAKLATQMPALGMLPRTRRMMSSGLSIQDDLSALFQFSLEAGQMSICVLDQGSNVLKTFGNMQTLLHIPEGGFSTNIFDLCDDRLRSTIALVIRGAEDQTTAQASDMRLIEGDSVRTVSVSARKIIWEGHASAVALFVRQITQTLPKAAAENSDEEPQIESSAYIEHLESEVRSLQEMLGVTAQDLGASNEELQAANEELIAANEELQANNEETQSINEELHTVNSENIDRIAELEQVNADVDNLLETAALGILLLDTDMCIRRFSAGVTRYLDLKHSDLGRPLESFATALLPEAVTLLVDDARLARDEGEETQRELRRRDGGFVQTRVRRFTRQRGDTHGVVITLLDITDTKLLEQEARRQSEILSSVLESEESGYWDWNIPEDKLYISRRFVEFLGFGVGELAPNSSAWLGLIHSDDRPQFHEAYRAHVNARGEVPFLIEARYLTKAGEEVWIRSRGQVTDWGQDHRPLRMIGVHQNISDLRAREDDIEKRADDMRRFAYVLAHDLKQPLNTIEGSVQALDEELPKTLDADIHELMRFLQQGTQRLKARVNAVLDYARLQDQTTLFEPCDLAQIIDACLADLEDTVAQANAEIVIEPLPGVSGTPELLARLMRNLLSNALKFRDPARPLKITIAATNAPYGRVGLRVDDTGIGIAPQDRARVFELFSRLHVESEIEGSGLGLAMCDQIVSIHGGQLEVVEAETGGASFRFTLPAAPAAPDGA